MLEIGLLRPRPKGTAKYFLGIFFVNKMDKKQKRLILDGRIVNWAFVSAPGVSLCSSEGMARIEWKKEVQLGSQHSRASSSVLDRVTSRTVLSSHSWVPLFGWSCLGPTGSHIMDDRLLPASSPLETDKKKRWAPNDFVFVGNLGVLWCMQGLGERQTV